MKKIYKNELPEGTKDWRQFIRKFSHTFKKEPARFEFGIHGTEKRYYVDGDFAKARAWEEENNYFKHTLFN